MTLLHLVLLALVAAALWMFGQLLRLLAVEEGQTVRGAIRCWWRDGRHVPVRHILGGYRCGICGLAAATLEGLGYGGQVSSPRRVYDRDARTLTRTSEWGGL